MISIIFLEKNTIYDADGEDRIIFAADNIDAGKFERADNPEDGSSNSIWQSTVRDEEGNSLMTAIRQGSSQDLQIHYKDDSVTIKNFFLSPNVQKEDGNWSALGITLNNQNPRNLPNKSNVGTNHQVHRFTHTYIASESSSLSRDEVAALRLKDAQSVTSSLKDDSLFNSNNGSVVAYLDAGNDVAYGGRGYDWLFGEEGNDILYGSALSARPAQYGEDEDRDYLVGGAGNDLIYGLDGDDIIYTEEDNSRGKKSSYLSTTNSNKRGDWASGGKGNDQIYGSENKDFLLGGEGSDVIRAGASDDVVIGDGNIFPNVKLHRLTDTIDEFTNGRLSSTVTGFVMRPQNLSFDENTDDVTKPPHLLNQNAWKVEIVDKEKGDYKVSHALNLRFDEPISSSAKNSVDYLYGGAGNDLIIG